MNARSRLTALERAAGAGVCPACGWAADGEPGPGVEFIIGEPGDPALPPCGTCGRAVPAFTLNIGEMVEASE